MGNDALEDDLIPLTSRDKGLDTNIRLHRFYESKSLLQKIDNLPPSPLHCSDLYSSSPLDSPLPSPLHGSCLTPRQLMTPTCSPLPRVSDVSHVAPISPLARQKTKC